MNFYSPKKEPATVGDRIKQNMKGHVENLKETRDNFLVWLLSTVKGWLLILSVLAIVVSVFTGGLGATIGVVALVWIIYGVGKLFNPF